MAMENIKKQKYKDENKNFQEEWVENYGLIDNNGKSCLICNITIKKYKVSNLHQHYEINHPHFSTQNYEPRNLNPCNLVFLNNMTFNFI